MMVRITATRNNYFDQTVEMSEAEYISLLAKLEKNRRDGAEEIGEWLDKSDYDAFEFEDVEMRIVKDKRPGRESPD